ncbi:RNA polymerase sigma factor [Candidatus Poribacteria bacterium]|nr:RNA polymerase sigma factor [Candidatus Poribacteria bacterium]
MRTEDGRLIHKCLNGEPEAFGFLVDRYKASVYAFVYARIGNFHDAEDVTQEVFLNAYERLGTLRCWDNFYAWLYSIASNLCKNYWRSRSRRVDSEYVEDQGEEFLEQLSMDAYQAQLRYQELHNALASLPQLYREVLTLYYLGGMTSQEIATFLRTSVTNIHTRLSRARSLLKEEMIAMMSTTFNEMKLQPSFTFRVVEAIKRTRIQTAPPKTALPLGVSAAAGLIALILSLMVPHSPLYPIGELIREDLCHGGNITRFCDSPFNRGRI